MVVPFLFAMLSAPAVTQATPPLDRVLPGSPEQKICPDIRPRIATVLRKNVRPQRLDRLPPGRLEHSVFRQVGGCPIPAVLRDEVGR